MINRFSFALLVSASFATLLEAADTTLWEPGKVIDGEDYLLQITIPNVYFHSDGLRGPPQ